MASLGGFSLRTCLLIALAVSSVQSVPANGVERIVGGKNAAEAQFPYQISLRNDSVHWCGGSILSENYILTAAHCVTRESGSGGYVLEPVHRLSIQAGSNDRFRGGTILPVAEIIVHEDYGEFLNDIALLRLERPLIFTRNIQPIALASSETPDDVDIVVSGWGRLKTMGRVPRYLQYNTLQSISFERCDEMIGWGVEMELCLHHEVGNGACNGDSGGPATYNNEVVGVAGFVMGGCGTEYPDGYARVYYYVDWIKKHSNISNF